MSNCWIFITHVTSLRYTLSSKALVPASHSGNADCLLTRCMSGCDGQHSTFQQKPPSQGLVAKPQQSVSALLNSELLSQQVTWLKHAMLHGCMHSKASWHQKHEA